MRNINIPDDDNKLRICVSIFYLNVVEVNIKNIISRLDAFINQKMILHFAIYFILVFVIPFCYKAVWHYHASDGFLSRNLIFSFHFIHHSVAVLISDTIQIMAWSKLNKMFKYSMRRIILIYIYNKILLPVTGFWVYFTLNNLYSFYNMIYMLVFTLICFCLFKNCKKHYKVFCVILVFLMKIISFIYVYQFFS